MGVRDCLCEKGPSQQTEAACHWDRSGRSLVASPAAGGIDCGLVVAGENTEERGDQMAIQRIEEMEQFPTQER